MTAADLALFYQALLDGGRALAGVELWSPETLALARRVRTGTLRDPVFGKLVQRGLGIVIAGDSERTFRGFGHTNSEQAFGHNGADFLNHRRARRFDHHTWQHGAGCVIDVPVMLA